MKTLSCPDRRESQLYRESNQGTLLASPAANGTARISAVPRVVAASVVAALALFASACQSSSNTTRGAGVGAATGAVIGGIIGHQSGEAGAGAAVGAAVGGVAGGAYGRHQDNEANRPGYSWDNDKYLAQLTPDELNTLKARADASGRSNPPLGDFLTAVEKENLRARASRTREIGK